MYLCVCVHVLNSSLFLGTSFESETHFMNIQSPNKVNYRMQREQNGRPVAQWIVINPSHSLNFSRSHGTCYFYFPVFFFKSPKTTGARGQVQQENSISLFSFQAPWRVYLCFTAGWCHLDIDCMWEAAGFRRGGSDRSHDPDEPRICHTLQGRISSSHTNSQCFSILMLLWDGSVVFL